MFCYEVSHIHMPTAYMNNVSFAHRRRLILQRLPTSIVRPQIHLAWRQTTLKTKLQKKVLIVPKRAILPRMPVCERCLLQRRHKRLLWHYCSDFCVQVVLPLHYNSTLPALACFYLFRADFICGNHKSRLLVDNQLSAPSPQSMCVLTSSGAVCWILFFIVPTSNYPLVGTIPPLTGFVLRSQIRPLDSVDRHYIRTHLGIELDPDDAAQLRFF